MLSDDSLTCSLSVIDGVYDRDNRRLWDDDCAILVARLPNSTRRAFHKEDMALRAVRGFCARADVVLVDQVCDYFEASAVYSERPGIIFELMTSIEFHSARKGYRP
jgi:hypothetical protein